FKYSYDFNNDGTFDVVDSTNATATFKFKHDGSFMVKGRIKDKDGGFTDYTTTVTVTNVDLVVTGADTGGGPHVIVRDAASGAVLFSFFAFAPNFTGGVRVATGDINGDGAPDIVVAAGAGGGPHVRVYDGNSGQLSNGFFAYDPSFTGGIYVVTGDVNGDGKADIIVGARAGGGPPVEGVDGTQLG